MGIEAIVFDLDDTIYPEEQYVLSGLHAVDIWLKSNLNIIGFNEYSVEIYRKGIRGKIFDRTLEVLGIECSSKLIEKMVKVYREHYPNISAFEDAKLALAHFQRQCKLGLLTDGYLLAQRIKVNALSIKEHFQTIVFSDQYGRENWKPSLLPYLKVQKDLKCDHRNMVYVGDNPGKDFIGARKLGWRTVHVSRIEGQYFNNIVSEEYCADYRINSLTELVNVLGELDLD